MQFKWKGQKVIVSSEGFTLIELIFVISIIAILSAVALPRLMDTQDNAHDAAVSAVGGALASAVIMARAQWVANNDSGTVTGIQGYGLNNIATSSSGWPTDAGKGAGSNHNPVISSTQRCIDLWRSLLVANSPSVSASDASNPEYKADTLDGNCRYTYKRKRGNSNIIYNARTGEVITNIVN